MSVKGEQIAHGMIGVVLLEHEAKFDGSHKMDHSSYNGVRVLPSIIALVYKLILTRSWIVRYSAFSELFATER